MLQVIADFTDYNIITSDSVQGNLTLRLNVDNVFDKQYVGSVIVNQGAGQFFEPASERQLLLGVTLGMKWK